MQGIFLLFQTLPSAHFNCNIWWKEILMLKIRKKLAPGSPAQWPSLVIEALFNWGSNRPQIFIKRKLLLLAKKSLGTVRLIAWVCPKMIKLLMYIKLAICVMTDFKKVPKNACFSAQNILEPLPSLDMYFLYLKSCWKTRKCLI